MPFIDAGHLISKQPINNDFLGGSSNMGLHCPG